MSVSESWYEEKQSAYLYKVMAAVEEAPARKTLFTALADAAESQARIWEERMHAEYIEYPASYRPSLRTRFVAWLIRTAGPRSIRPVLAAMKVRGLSVYSGEMIHAGHPMPTTVDEIGHRHTTFGGGGNLRAAVFGVSDGLVSNASLVMGVAGATQDGKMIFLTGIAGLIAGAASMAAGEYISVRSQRELYEYQIGLERDELREYPQEEAEELALIYNARGVAMDQARQLASGIFQDPEHALNTLSREELGLNPQDLGSPRGAALSSFVSFALGALAPLLPFVFGVRDQPVPAIMLVTGVSLFLVGAVLSLFTGRGAMRGGVRMVLIGGSAGLIAYLIGIVLGISLL